MAGAKKERGSTDAREIGPRFKQARNALKLTQAHLCDPIGISPTALSRFEKGRRGIQSDKLLALLRLGAEKGMNIDGFVLRGQGEPIRSGSESEMLSRILAAVEARNPAAAPELPAGRRVAR